MINAGRPGQPLKPGEYRQGGNVVRLESGGKITVKPGDTISKYALCLYGNARSGWSDFGRLVGSQPQTLADVNQIRVGEILIHTPTFRIDTKGAPKLEGAADGSEEISLSVSEAAYLADDVYHAGRHCGTVGWKRIHGHDTGGGFAAARFRKGDLYAVAFRGTDDFHDWLFANLFMAPQLDSRRVERVLKILLSLYGIRDRNLDLIVRVIILAMNHPNAVFGSRVVGLFTNRVPPWQTDQAIQYFDATPGPVVGVTGHSLGGALAKAISSQRSVPSVAFNSPFMGTMKGTGQKFSPLIRNVFTPLDPLTIITRELGNQSQGRVTSRLVEHFPRPPEWYSSRDQAWLGRVIGELPDGEPKRQLEGVANIIAWLGAAALHYHSMGTMRRAIRPSDSESRVCAPKHAG